MAIDKKNAKARLDKYYHLAKEKGYRARAAFKLVQLNKKYGFLQQSRCLIDLCAAPGSWMQVAAETMPVKSLIVGVDLDPIKPIPKTISFQGDITTEKCRATLRGHLKTWKADTVIHDGAPNVGTAWVQDAFSQNELVLASLKLATEFLAPNGCFVTKVFRSKDSQKLEWVFKQLFEKVEQTKPPSSRNVSAETFYVCRGYKAPKNLDPRFLDANYAFAEVKEKAPNMEAKVFNPEKKKRKRDGYEEGDWTQFHEVSVTEFIESEDPIQLLGSLNRLHFREENNKDDVLKIVDSLPETTEEVKLCTQDLKVLGRKEFKMLLRWRLKARRVMGLSVKKAPLVSEASLKSTNTDDADATEGVTVESMDDELRLQQEIAQMKEMADKNKRKERRKENERKQKEITRLQMHMITPTDIGIEAADNGDNTFKLRDVDKSGIARELSRARMHTTVEPDKHHEFEEEEEYEDEDGDRLEAELDQMYQQYTEKREDRSAKVKAKRARMKARGGSDDEFEGFGSDNNDENSDSDDGLRMEDDDDASSDEEEDENGDKLMTDLQSKPAPRKDGLTNRAANFFEQDIFKDIGGVDDDVEEDDEDEVDPDSGVDVNSASPEPNEAAKAKIAKATKKAAPFAKDDEDSDDEIEYVDTAPDEQMEWEDEEDAEAARGKPNIDIITAEAMTLAHQLATGKVTKQQLLDDNFNKISLRDVDGLPEWFLDDENQHSKTQRPITKEAAAAIKEKTKALNARPIKKVREAKARKTMRAARRVEKLKKKSEGLAEGDDLSEKDKATNIAKIMSKAKKGVNKKPQPKLVVAGGFNKGKGRPRGIKGKYKMVDARMKKETRALKRIAKKKK
ncbi:hypothetical protein MBLNU13_g02780t1 [Cladosporium sp. NU13]